MAKKFIKHTNISPFPPLFNFSLRSKYIFLATIGLIFYANSVLNKYAFDDRPTIEENEYVQMGFSGIPKILTHDSWTSYYNSLGANSSATPLSGGRFRPLSEIIFAIEQQLLGGSVLLPYFRHLVNVLAYMACIVAIFYFLEKILFKKIPWGSDMAFLSTFLFAIHPLHTEVVANIKSLDEILSLLFIMLTFIYSLKYLQGRKIKQLMVGLGSLLLALLSKEYAVTLIFFIPFLFYLLEDKKPASAIKASIPYYGIFAIYLLLRYNAVGFHLINVQSNNLSPNPDFYATPAQKIATEWFVLGKYLGLLFFPYPLAYDYSYNQIPYHHFSDITVLLSILIYLGIFIWGIMLTRKKNVLSFAVFFFLFNIFMISNFVLDIGAPMGERLAFLSSLGFVIILSHYLLKMTFSKAPFKTKVRLQTKKSLLISTLSVIGIICFGETVIRNTQWKDDNTLDLHDVRVVPNSSLVNDNAGAAYMDLSIRNPDKASAYHDSAHKYLLRSLHLNPNFVSAYLNLEVVYLQQGLIDSATYCYDKITKLNVVQKQLNSSYAQLLFSQGLHLIVRSGKPREGIIYLKKALLIDSANSKIWYNMGIAYYHIQEYDSARYAFMKTLQNKPDSMDAINARKDIQILSEMKKQ